MFEFVDCGHIRDMDLSKAKDGSFVCHQCDETSYTLPSNIYLLKISTATFEWLKFGYAKVIETRIKQYGLPKSAKVHILSTFPTLTGEHAIKIEKTIERKYKTHILNSVVMRKFHTQSGFTECYPISLRAEMEAELSIINHKINRV